MSDMVGNLQAQQNHASIITIGKFLIQAVREMYACTQCM